MRLRKDRRAQRVREAGERNAAYALLSIEQKLLRLPKSGAARQRAKLSVKFEQALATTLAGRKKSNVARKLPMSMRLK